MENRDFRHRLNNHKQGSNPDAWDQMSQMLDSLPQKKKKKRFLWIWFVGILFLMTLPLYLFISDNKGMNSESFAIQEEANISQQEITSGHKMTDKAPLGNIATSSTEEKSLTPIAEEVEIMKERSIDNRSQNIDTNPDLYTENSTVQKKDGEDDSINDIELKSTQSPIVKSTNTELVPETTSSKQGAKIKTTNRAEVTSESSKETSDAIKSSSNNNQPISDDKFDASITTNAVRPNDTETVDYLNLLLNGVELMDRTKLTSPQIKLNHSSKFHYYLGGGYAQFNANHGFILMGGLRYDLDRIMDIETDLAYSYGSDKNARVGEEIEFENQIDLNIIFHLNFIKNRTNKLAFFAGVGYTKYSGQRVINVPAEFNVRSSFSRNFKFGFDYQYNLDPDKAVGLRIGVIAYDDAVSFIAPYFSNRF